MSFYNDWAQRILQGLWTDHLTFYGLPGYAYLLALLYKIFGYGPFMPGLLQAGLDAGTATLLYKIGRSVFGTEQPMNAAGKANSVLQTAGSIHRTGRGRWLGLVRSRPSLLNHSHAHGMASLCLLVSRLARGRIEPAAHFPRLSCLRTADRCHRDRDRDDPLPGSPVGRRDSFARKSERSSGRPERSRPWWPESPPAPLPAGSTTTSSRAIPFSSPRTAASTFGSAITQWPTAILEFLRDCARDKVRCCRIRSPWQKRRPAIRCRAPPFRTTGVTKARDYIRGHFGEWLRLLTTKLRNFWNAFQYDDLSIVTGLCEEGVILPGPRFGVVAALALPGMFLRSAHISPAVDGSSPPFCSTWFRC